MQSSSQLEALKSKMTPIGELTKTMHKVEGMVWTLNDSVIVIENFVYDGKGFGVHINVGEFNGRNIVKRNTFGSNSHFFPSHPSRSTECS